MKFKFLKEINKVAYLTDEVNNFQSLYLKVRGRENRVLTDSQVKALPIMSSDDHLSAEWKLRQKSAKRFIHYLQRKNKPMRICDVGCGNGWFTHKMATLSLGHDIVGLDINRSELEQAARVFEKDNLQFVFGNLFFLEPVFRGQFDLITLNACVQYFEDVNELMAQLKMFLRPLGEIHIIDSPFYAKEAISSAKLRSNAYYSNLGFPEMAALYHHHCLDDVRGFDVLYRPKKKLFQKVIGRKDSPFPWLRFSNG